MINKSHFLVLSILSLSLFAYYMGSRLLVLSWENVDLNVIQISSSKPLENLVHLYFTSITYFKRYSLEDQYCTPSNNLKRVVFVARSFPLNLRLTQAWNGI